ncbi:ThuA domain-containing protein [uncultured Draconibacterium sp.]|uniref:ThuA domain-containing protein n=1 Tax=uncultured Draconibacterium sp. TaxID=1573823 RepID=UPI00326028F4
MIRILKYIILLIFIPQIICACTGNNKNTVLIVDGFSNHNWKQTTQVVTSILEESGLFHVSVSTSPSEPDDGGWSLWNPDFKAYDVVLLNCNNIHNKEIRWPEDVEKKLEKYVAEGGGLYILHSANNAFAHWPEYNKMIGLGWRSPEQGVALQVEDDGEIKRIPVGQGKSTYHGPRHDAVIQILNNHPINKNYPKAWLTPDMELYKFARGPAENLTVLSYSTDPETNINWPVDWVVAYGKGRVYNSSMGHLWKGDTYPVGYRCNGFQTTLIRATEWLATGKTSYKVPTDFPTQNKVSLVAEETEK